MIIFYLVDGARPDVMRELLENGDLPNIQKEILSRGTFRIASSSLPSTTGPAYLPFLTGCFPGTLNIPGIRWLDKHQFYQHFFNRNRFRSYNGYEAVWFNTDLPKEYPTLYELLPKSYNILSMITRGLPKGYDLTARSKAFLYLFAHLTDKWDPVNQVSHCRLMRCLDQRPDFVFTVFPGVDSYSHLFHPRHDHTLNAYRFVDYSIGQVVEKLKKMRLWDETLIIITSDHGLTATHTHLDLALFLQRRGIDTLYYPIVWKARPAASVMISGNAFGHVYLLNGLDGNHLFTAEIQELLGEVWDELLQREEVDFIASRKAEGEYDILSARGNATIMRKNGGLCYLPESGDPLGLGRLDTPLDRQAALEKTFESDYPDALVQIDQLFSASRTGDFFVISKNGYDLRKAWEWPEHHSSHGSLHRKHMHVPLIYNRTDWREGPCRTTDLFNTILQFAGKPTLEHTDGQSLIQ